MVGEDGGELGLVGQDGVEGGGVDLAEGLVRGGEDREGTGALEGVDQAVRRQREDVEKEGEKSCGNLRVRTLACSRPTLWPPVLA